MPDEPQKLTPELVAEWEKKIGIPKDPNRAAPNDVLTQKDHPIVPFDDDMVGPDHRGKTLPPTSGGYGEKELEKAIGSSPSGHRPVEEKVFD